MRVETPRIGELRERVTFQVNTEVDDGAHGFTDGWANISSVPTVSAKVEPVRGGEPRSGGQATPTQTYLVVIRHRTDITMAHRIVWNSKNLNIRSATNRDMKKRFLWLECEDGVTD